MAELEFPGGSRGRWAMAAAAASVLVTFAYVASLVAAAVPVMWKFDFESKPYVYVVRESAAIFVVWSLVTGGVWLVHGARAGSRLVVAFGAAQLAAACLYVVCVVYALLGISVFVSGESATVRAGGSAMARSAAR